MYQQFRKRANFPLSCAIVFAGLLGQAAIAFECQAQTKTPSDNKPLTKLKRDGDSIIGTMKAHATRKDAKIQAGNVELNARLFMPPNAKKPCPAVVLVHGSGRTTIRDQWYFYISIALRCRLAVLAYDKRGCGKSTGTYEKVTVAKSKVQLNALASDAAAAFQWLRKQKGIDPDRVGFMGGSQAGWIMPLAANKTKGVAFIVHGQGPTVSYGEEMYHAGLLARGIKLEEADRLTNNFKGPLGYDPRSVIKESKIPMLWIFGSRDDVIPTNLCITELKKIIDGGKKNHTMHVIKDCNHNYRNPDTGDGFMIEPVITAYLSKIGILR